MDNVINFLEKYWGVSVLGGTTIGTVITFIVVQVKTILKDKTQKASLNTALNKIDQLCNELNTREEAHEQERAKLEKQVAKQQHKLQETSKYYANIQAATFQAISYLVMASKLPTEDKIALQKKFTTLVNTKVAEYKEVLKDEVQALKTEVETKVIPDAVQSVTQTVDETKSLLDKYMKEG